MEVDEQQTRSCDGHRVTRSTRPPQGRQGEGGVSHAPAERKGERNCRRTGRHTHHGPYPTPAQPSPSGDLSSRSSSRDVADICDCFADQAMRSLLPGQHSYRYLSNCLTLLARPIDRPPMLRRKGDAEPAALGVRGLLGWLVSPAGQQLTQLPHLHLLTSVTIVPSHSLPSRS